MENTTAPFSSRIDTLPQNQITDLKHRNSAVINYISKTKKSIHKLNPDLEKPSNVGVFNKSSFHASNGFKVGRNSTKSSKKFRNRLVYLKSNTKMNIAHSPMHRSLSESRNDL